DDQRREHLPTLDIGLGGAGISTGTSSGVSSIAYAGGRLVILADDTLTGLRLDGSWSSPEPQPGAIGLMPSGVPGSCLLMSAADQSPEPALRAWLINETGVRVPCFTVPAGHTLLSVSDPTRRYTTGTPGGGCALWQGYSELAAWPDARDATLAADGTLVAVSRPGRVELYEVLPRQRPACA